MGKLNISKEKERFLKFAVVGSIGFIIDFSIMNLMSNVLGFTLFVSSSVSFLFAVTSNFVFHRFWTFPESRSKNIGNQLSQFVVVSILGYMIRTVILFLIIGPYEKILIFVFTENFIYLELLTKNLALVTVVLIVMLWNYFVNRKWTYNDIES